MKHCESTIFHGDKYCADCGEHLTTVPTLRGVEEINPDIFNDVREYYPEAEAKTGRVLESRLYKRFSKTSKQNLEFSYWWIKLETTQGEIIETSISAEHKYTTTIGRGDILTLYYPTTMNLLYRKSREAKSFVKDNKAVPCVVVHDDEEQRYTVENLYPRPTKSVAWLWIVAGLVSAFMVYDSSPDASWIVGLVVAITVLYFEIERNKKKFVQATAQYDALIGSFKKLLDVTKRQLGYSNIERQKDASDVICIQCNTRLPETTGYCVCCGNQSAPQVPPAIAANSSAEFGQISAEIPTGDASQAIAELDNAQSTATPASVSVSDIQQRLDKIYSFNLQDNYTHKYALKSAREGKLTNEFILARVKSMSVNANVSDVTRHTTTTTETKHYRGSNYQYSTYDTKHTSFRNRSSTLKGKVLLEYVSGETVTFTLSEDILGSVDTGDWLAIGDSCIEFENSRLYYFEYAYNITKDKEYFDSSFAGYADVRGSNVFWGWNALFTIGGIAALFANIVPAAQLSLAGLVLFNLYALIKVITCSIGNKSRRKQLLQPLQGRISEFKQSLQQLKKQLEVLG